MKIVYYLFTFDYLHFDGIAAIWMFGRPKSARFNNADLSSVEAPLPIFVTAAPRKGSPIVYSHC